MTTQTLLIIILVIALIGGSPWYAGSYYPDAYNRRTHVSLAGVLVVILILYVLGVRLR